MEIEEDEHIDKTEWLAKGEMIVNVWREQHGDIRVERDDEGHIRFAQSHVKNILNFLIEETVIDGVKQSIIDENMHHDGQTFQIWREMHKASMGYMKATVFGVSEPQGVQLKAHGYIMIMLRLGQHHQKTLVRAVDSFVTEFTRYWTIKNRRQYRAALQALSEIMPAIRENIAAMEKLSDEDRQKIYKDKLKKYIDSINEKKHYDNSRHHNYVQN